jgi:hypothetical protein
MWFCDGCQKQFETKEEALEHEKTCQKAIDFMKSQEEENKLKEKIKEEEKRLLEEKRQRERESKLLLQNKILEEEKELELFTYHTMNSDNRFPYLNTYISLLKIFAVVAIVGGILIFVISIDEGLGILGSIFVIYSLFVALGFLMTTEIIRLLLDFHNNNHTNTKVKIETLKVLEKISDKLDK